jgi:hypothetical protein
MPGNEEPSTIPTSSPATQSPMDTMQEMRRKLRSQKRRKAVQQNGAWEF